MNKKLVSILSLSPALALMSSFVAAQPEDSAAFKKEHQEITRGSADGNTNAPFSQHPNSYLYIEGSIPDPTDPAKTPESMNFTSSGLPEQGDKPEKQPAKLKTIAPNMEPIVVHENEWREAAEKLKKFGKKPNILIFVTDDVGWMDVGFNGGGVSVGNPTPNIDKIAQQGLILTSAYSAPSSSPTRATIHTGQNPLHHGILSPPMYGQPGGIHGPLTLPALLKNSQEYVTQGVGKWHLGESCTSQPQNVGYDNYYGFLSVSDMYTEWRDQYFNPEIVYNAQRFKALESPSMFNHCNINVSAVNDGGEQFCLNPTKLPQCGNKEGGHGYYEINLSTIKELDQDWARKSVEFIHERARQPEKPWFLYHATRAAHFDNYPSDKYAGKSPAMTVFSDAIVEIDDIFGKIVNSLQETGQLENTVIIFTSDNGPEGEIPPHGRTPFRGHKGSSWEGGVRVPTFVYWKGQIEPRKSDGLFDLADIFNTSLSLAGIPGGDINTLLLTEKDVRKEEIEKHYIDGVDQTPFLLAKDGQSCRRSRIYTLNQYFSAVRIDEFKYSMKVELEDAIFPRGYSAGFSGAIVTDTGGATMTNLYTDPQEDVNIGIRHTPVAVQIGNEIQRYGKVLAKYPPKKVVDAVKNVEEKLSK